MYEVPPALVEKAVPLVQPHVKRTPLIPSEWLTALHGSPVFLKCENLQYTGSFKIRGPFVKLADPAVRRRGVVASSAGNHGAGLARAAKELGVRCVVVVPRSVPRVKAQKIRRFGAKLVVSPYDDYDSTEEYARERAGRAEFVSPFDDPEIIAGNGGTLGLEIAGDFPDLEAVVAPCGGGGLCVGLGVAMRMAAPQAAVYGVNSEASPGMWSSRRDGVAHLRILSKPTIAEGIEGGVSETTFQLGREFISDMFQVSEAAITAAVAELYWRHQLVVEGAGAVGVAAVMEGLVPKGKRGIAVLVSGGNIDPRRLIGILKRHPDPREAAVLWKEQQKAAFPASCTRGKLDGRPLKEIDTIVGLALVPVLGTAGQVRPLTTPERQRLVGVEDLLGRVLEESRLDEEGTAYFGRLHRLVTEVLRRGG